ncbi:hypothetical protein Taro_039444 [Colocasia esculenta]|uniref:Uncharacterized protein n=1 Tax=Colocasia esculenta TaxID=4460 RepID=A0A843WQ73_COLES|nr:hypothetical protein [Colocasia esculenta]
MKKTLVDFFPILRDFATHEVCEFDLIKDINIYHQRDSTQQYPPVLFLFSSQHEDWIYVVMEAVDANLFLIVEALVKNLDRHADDVGTMNGMNNASIHACGQKDACDAYLSRASFGGPRLILRTEGLRIMLIRSFFKSSGYLG